MGRKQKLRQARKVKNATRASSSTTTTAATATRVGDHVFPKSEPFVQVMESIMNEKVYTLEGRIGTLLRGAAEYSCVHSMRVLGEYYLRPELNGSQIPLAHPWLLEGAIRGFLPCMIELWGKIYSNKALFTADLPVALQKYWINMWNNNSSHSNDTKLDLTVYKNGLTRTCSMCEKEDTDTLTLRQCMGCSTYCYCCEICQTSHWKKHKGECKQLQILNKYHLPYAKEIREACIRGDLFIPALEKLRSKLGLSRPKEDYEELLLQLRRRDDDDDDDDYDDSDSTTHYHQEEGKPIHVNDDDELCKYVIARKDGTVWIGSTPNPTTATIGQTSSDTTSTSTTTATTTTTTTTTTMKQEHFNGED